MLYNVPDVLVQLHMCIICCCKVRTYGEHGGSAEKMRLSANRTFGEAIGGLGSSLCPNRCSFWPEFPLVPRERARKEHVQQASIEKRSLNLCLQAYSTFRVNMSVVCKIMVRVDSSFFHIFSCVFLCLVFYPQVNNEWNPVQWTSVWGSSSPFFSNFNLAVENKIMKAAVPVLDGLEDKMTLLFQGTMGRGRSHPV